MNRCLAFGMTFLALGCTSVAWAASTSIGASTSAFASSAPAGYFKTPSGNIVCYHAPGRVDMSTAFVACGIKSKLRPPPPRKPCVDGGYAGDRITLMERGRPSVPACAGDPGALVGERAARVLAYGRTWRGDGLRCSSAFTGLTCRNRIGHGFFLSRERYRLF
jgi:hypothetical protein